MSTWKCQLCVDGGGDAPIEVLDLGDVAFPNVMLPSAPTWPMRVVRCARCGLVQLHAVPDPSLVYPPDYAYRTGQTKAMRVHFAGLAGRIHGELGSKAREARYLDIGGNDGTLLRALGANNVSKDRYLNVEPTEAGFDSFEHAVWSRHFWTESTARTMGGTLGPFDVITACNVFAHSPDPLGFLRGIESALAPFGFAVIEVGYWPVQVLQNHGIDCVYAEHVRYWTGAALDWALDHAGLHCFHAEQIPTHGGSIRVWVRKAGEVIQRVRLDSFDGDLRVAETGFAWSLAHEKARFWDTFQHRAQPMIGVCAPSRAVTLCKWLGLSRLELTCIAEQPTSPKVGGVLPGTGIPIVAEDEALKGAGSAVLLAWHLDPAPFQAKLGDIPLYVPFGGTPGVGGLPR